MILAAFIVLIILGALIVGAMAGGTIIAVILLIIGVLALVIKAASKDDSNTVNVTVNNPDVKEKMFPEAVSSGDVLILPEKKEENENKAIVITYDQASDREVSEEIKVSLERAYIALTGLQYDEANVHFDRILDKEPRFAPAYIGKLLCELKIRDEKNLAYVRINYTTSPYWDSACRFATEAELERYQRYFRECKVNLDKYYRQRLEKRQSEKVSLFDTSGNLIERYDKAIERIRSFGEDQALARLISLIEDAKKKYQKTVKKNVIKVVLGTVVFLILMAAIAVYGHQFGLF